MYDTYRVALDMYMSIHMYVHMYAHVNALHMQVKTDLYIIHHQGSISFTDVTISQLNIKRNSSNVGNNTEHEFEIF